MPTSPAQGVYRPAIAVLRHPSVRATPCGKAKAADVTFQNAVKAAAKNPFAIASAAGGIINSLIGSKKAPTYQITLEGEIALEGEMSLTTTRGSIAVYLRHDAVNQGQYKALQTIPWGVVNYTNGGVPLATKFLRIRNWYVRWWDYELYSPRGFERNLLVFNPAIKNDVAKTQIAWVYPKKDDLQFRQTSPTTDFPEYRYEISVPGSDHDPRMNDHPDKPRGVGVMVTFKNGDQIYNRVPMKDYRAN